MAPADRGSMVESLLESAEQYFEQKEYVKALKEYTRLVNMEPSHEAGCLGKVTTLQQLQRPRGALKACEIALGLLPASQSMLALRERLCHELGEEAASICADVALPGTSLNQFLDCRQDCEETSTCSDDGQYADCESSHSEDEGGPDPCPASKSQDRVRREQLKLKAQGRSHGTIAPEPLCMDSEASAAYRAATKAHLLRFYRGMYASTRSTSVDTTQYTKAEKSGLSIKGGHQPMQRPEQVDLPIDYKEPVGSLSPAELAMFNGKGRGGFSEGDMKCSDGRMLISVYGDIFDVSDRPDKYGPEGPYSSMAGHDMTWALWSGLDTDEELDKYFDLHRAAPREQRDRRLQGLISWWAFFEQEYGSPVGRLNVYDCEWELPPPPAVEDLCTVM